mgnify:CR=1 FL=1
MCEERRGGRVKRKRSHAGVILLSQPISIGEQALGVSSSGLITSETYAAIPGEEAVEMMSRM